MLFPEHAGIGVSIPTSYFLRGSSLTATEMLRIYPRGKLVKFT